ncbi:MAG: hypothetical protein EAX96_07475 [Candidatus Lokiarchaeota archaeon]|nr:hypothetical protein [Candidatus Lokiarchaeota archaeon]
MKISNLGNNKHGKAKRLVTRLTEEMLVISREIRIIETTETRLAELLAFLSERMLVWLPKDLNKPNIFYKIKGGESNEEGWKNSTWFSFKFFDFIHNWWNMLSNFLDFINI